MTQKHSVVALLPMKANSERVPNKNFRDFAGKPLFRWILDSLLEIDEIDLVVINTDAREILEQNGLVDIDRVLVRDRPEEICGDMVSMNLVIQNDVENVAADTYMMTHTTNPLLTKSSMANALKYFQQSNSDEGADSLFTVNKVQTRFYREDGSAVNHDPGNLIRTQDLEPWFEENSNLYIFTAESFAKTKARIGQKPVMFETPSLESYDIDDQDDWNLAELIASARQKS
jgi:CMP-N-acetylneuraminic acid synthetase